MNILLPPDSLLFWLSCFIALPCLLLALRHASWHLLFAQQVRQHAFFAVIFCLATLWLLQIAVKDTMAFHPLLMTVTTMIFGWSFAILIGATALIVLKIFQLAVHLANMDSAAAWAQFDLTTVPVDFCLSVAVPVGWTWCVIWFVNRWKLKNPFTYFLGVGFFGAMTSCILTDVSALVLFTISGSDIYADVAQEHFFSFLLMTFPEGFVNGTIATALTVFWPDIVKTYRDDWFLRG